MADASIRELERLAAADPSDQAAQARLARARERSNDVVVNEESLKLLDDYDWGEVFKYAKGFDMESVAEVLFASNGERDEANWVAVLRLRDGRFAYIEAGCDYTGWG